jgi:hypothetical protein
VLGRAHVGVVDEPDGAVAVWAALDLGEADVPEREGRQHLEEHRRALPVVREHDARLEWPVRSRDDGLPRQHHEPRHVPGVVLDAVREHLEPVQLGGAGGRDGGGVAEPRGGDVLGGGRGVVEGLAGDVEAHGVEGELALGERLRVGDDAGEEVPADAREREEAVVDGELDLADDVEAVAEEEVVVPVDAAAEGVLDGEDGAVGDPELDGLEGHLELVAGDGVAGGVGLRRRRLAVCPRDTLVGDAQLAAVHGRGGEVGDGERAREVGDGEQIQVERRRGVVGEGGLDATVAVAVHPRDSADGGAGGVPVGAGERGGARRADGRGSGDVGGARRGRGFHPPAVSGGEAGAARGWWRERAASRGEARRGVV